MPDPTHHSSDGQQSEPESSSEEQLSKDSSPTLIASSPTPVPSDVTFRATSSSVNIDDFLGPETRPQSPVLKTYKLVGDNIDKNVQPRIMRSDHQSRSLHYFHTYAVRDRVDLSSFSDQSQIPDIASIQLVNFLPTGSDERAIQRNFATLVARTLKKYMPFFSKFGQGLERHILHEYLEGSHEWNRSGATICLRFSISEHLLALLLPL